MNMAEYINKRDIVKTIINRFLKVLCDDDDRTIAKVAEALLDKDVSTDDRGGFYIEELHSSHRIE
jgi:hypothetical protein